MTLPRWSLPLKSLCHCPTWWFTHTMRLRNLWEEVISPIFSCICEYIQYAFICVSLKVYVGGLGCGEGGRKGGKESGRSDGQGNGSLNSQACTASSRDAPSTGMAVILHYSDQMQSVLFILSIWFANRSEVAKVMVTVTFRTSILMILLLKVLTLMTRIMVMMMKRMMVMVGDLGRRGWAELQTGKKELPARRRKKGRPVITRFLVCDLSPEILFAISLLAFPARSKHLLLPAHQHLLIQLPFSVLASQKKNISISFWIGWIVKPSLRSFFPPADEYRMYFWYASKGPDYTSFVILDKHSSHLDLEV